MVEVKVESPDEGQAFTPGALRDAGTDKDARGRRIKMVWADGPGMTWKAKVTFNGPVNERIAGQNIERGVEQMRAGFVNNVTVVRHRGTYNSNPQKSAKSELERGDPYWDPKGNFEGKLYSNAPAAKFDNPTPAQKTKMITEDDSPHSGPPTDLFGGQLIAMELDWDFDVYVVALTQDKRNGADQVYTGEASAKWSFNATGGINPGVANFTFTPANAVAGITHDNAWTPLNDGRRPVTDIPSFNSILNRANWN